MAERSIWEALTSENVGGVVVMYDGPIALVDDGERLWIADAALLRKALSGVTLEYLGELIDPPECPGWVVADIREGDEFPLEIHWCIHALEGCGYEEYVPAFWDRDEEAF